MRKADLLRLRDVRDAYRLIGDCRDLGSDPALWQMRMLSGLCQLVGAPIGSGGEAFWVRPTHPIQPLSSFDVGFDACGRERYMAYLRDLGPQGDPIFQCFNGCARSAPYAHAVCNRFRRRVVPIYGLQRIPQACR